MADLQLILEAERRGILPPEKQALLDEARRRGLIEGEAPPAAQQAEAAPADPMKRRLQDLGINPEQAYSRGVAQTAKELAGQFIGRGATTVGSTALDVARTIGGPRGLAGLMDQGRTSEQRKQAIEQTLGDMGVDITGTTPGGLAYDIAVTGGVPAVLGGFARAFGPRTAALAESLETMGLRGKNALTRALGGTIGGGAAAGMIEPTPESVALGATFGGVIPGAYRIGEGAVEAAGRYFRPSLLDATEGREQAIINELRRNQVLVPGSLPTAAEAATAAGAARFSGLQRGAEDVLPSAYAERARQQEAARLAAVQKVGGTPADLKAAEAARRAQADIDYQAAFNQTIKADADLVRLSKNPYFQMALPDARRIMQAKGLSPSDAVENLHSIKLSLDKMLAKTGDSALAGTERKLVQDLKKDLIGWIEQRVPAYRAAREEFARRSEPINQMEVGQYLERKLSSAVAGERPGVFAEALRDAPRTIKGATGFARFDDLKQVLTPNQVKVLEGVRDDLQRGKLFEELAAYGGRGRTELGQQASSRMQEDMIGIPPSLSTVRMIANYILNRLQGKIDRKLAVELAATMLDPKATADLLESEIIRRSTSSALLRSMPRVERFGLQTPADVRNQLLLMGVTAPSVIGANALASE